MSATILEALVMLSRREDLPRALASRSVGSIMAGEVAEPLIAAFLTALRFKGESAEELAGVVETVRSYSTGWDSDPLDPPFLDTCGTGGDGACSVNISTASAMVVAACGVPVAKHGNRSASGNSGSAEVLAALGIDVEPGMETLRAVLRDLGIAFLFAPRFHPALRFAAPVRRLLPFRTLFNLVGPLANPARPAYQLIGVPDDRVGALVAEAIASLGIARAAVVMGAGGLDEVSLDGPTSVRWVEGGRVSLTGWEPSEFGLSRVSADQLRVSGPAESASRIVEVFDGKFTPARDSIVANAAASLLVTGAARTLAEGVEIASAAVDDGRARRLLDDWRRACPIKPA